MFNCFARSRDVKLKLSYMFIRNKVLFKDFVRLSLPALGNDIVWGVAFSLYAAIIGNISDDAVAANAVAVVVRNFGTIFCYGIASAGGVLIGKIIGENDLEGARSGAKKMMKLTVISGIIGGVIVLWRLRGVVVFRKFLGLDVDGAFLFEMDADYQFLLHFGNGGEYVSHCRDFPGGRRQQIRLYLRYD